MKKKGINVRLVDSNNYVPSIQQQEPASAVSPLPDPIRYYGGQFWTAKSGRLVQNTEKIFFNAAAQDDILTLDANKLHFISENSFIDGVLDRKFDDIAWKTFIEDQLSAVSGVAYYDFYTDFSRPVNLAETPEEFPVGANFLNREFVYNFYTNEYENLVGNITFDITTLPSLYDVIAVKIGQATTERENLTLALGGLVSDEAVRQLSLATDSQKVQNYFREYSRAYDQLEARPVINQIKRYPKSIIFDFDRAKSGNNVRKKFVQFPFYMNATFSNLSPNVSSDFIHILRQHEADQELLSYLLQVFTAPRQNFIVEDGRISEQQLPYYNLKAWLDVNLRAASAVGDFYDTSARSYVKYTNILQYIKDNIKPKIRHYGDMNSSAGYDVLFYKIEKRLYNHTSDPLQTFYITPTNDEIVKFFDTQIKYGETYYYNITAITLVYGNKYTYSDYYGDNREIEKARDIKDGKYKVKINNKIEYRIFEMPYAKFNGAAYEAPLTKPVVQFKLLNEQPTIQIKQSSLESLEAFESLESGETELFEKVRAAQDNSEEGKIYSRNYGFADNKRLQIYKLADRPTSYASFRGRILKQLSLTPNDNIVTESMIKDKKYYYAFRYLNAHGMPSNVSDIHEVVLRDEDGLLYIEDRIYDISPEYERKPSKSMKKYLLLRPSILQLSPNLENEPGEVDEIKLGPDAGSVWDKRFVMTIRSKKSGRVLKYRFSINLERKN